MIPRAAKVRNDREWPLEDELAEGFKDPTLEGLERRPLVCALVDAADISLDMLPPRPFSDTPLSDTPLSESSRCPPCPDIIHVAPCDSRPTANDDDDDEEEEDEEKEEEEEEDDDDEEEEEQDGR